MKEEERICSACGGKEFSHEVKEGRGLPPKSYTDAHKDKKPKAMISWKGTWDFYTCKNCDEVIKILRRE